jgi:hypothetical protein
MKKLPNLLIAGISLILLCATAQAIKSTTRPAEAVDRVEIVEPSGSIDAPTDAPTDAPPGVEELPPGVIAESKIRYVMPTPKDCVIPGSKALCSEVGVYINARQNQAEVVAMVPNGRSVTIGQTVGDWTHVTLHDINGKITPKTGWTLSAWLKKSAN